MTIQPADPYTNEDLAYYTNGRADQEQNAPDARPADKRSGRGYVKVSDSCDRISYLGMGRLHALFLHFWKATIFKIRQSFHSVPLIPAVLEAVPLIWKKLCADSAEWKEGNDSIHRQQKVKLKTGLIALTSSRIIQNKRRQTRWEYLISKVKAYY